MGLCGNCTWGFIRSVLNLGRKKQERALLPMSAASRWVVDKESCAIFLQNPQCLPCAMERHVVWDCWPWSACKDASRSGDFVFSQGSLCFYRVKSKCRQHHSTWCSRAPSHQYPVSVRQHVDMLGSVLPPKEACPKEALGALLDQEFQQLFQNLIS